MNNILSLNKVSEELFRRNTYKCFSDINIDIKKEKKVAIIGPSGSGKTSILNILSMTERLIRSVYGNSK